MQELIDTLFNPILLAFAVILVTVPVIFILSALSDYFFDRELLEIDRQMEIKAKSLGI